MFYKQEYLKYFLFFLGEQPLQVARCTKIINEGSDDAKYIINVKQFAKFVVDLADTVSPTDIEEGMRVGYDQSIKTKGYFNYKNGSFSVEWIEINIKFIYHYHQKLIHQLL